MSASERRIAELEAEVAKLRHLLSQQLRSDDTIWSDGGVVPGEWRPFVSIRWGDMAGQLTVAEAKEFATNLISTAAATEWDAAFCRAMEAEESLPPEARTLEGIAVMLQLARKGRDLAKPESSGQVHANVKIERDNGA